MAGKIYLIQLNVVYTGQPD